MTQVDFHFNVPHRLQYACRLLRKAWQAGHCVLVSAPPATLDEFDRLLWTFAPLEFVPHCKVGNLLVARTPIVLAAVGDDHPDFRDVLLNLGDQPPPQFARFERLLEVVSRDDEEVAMARARYRFYRDRGYPVVHHDLKT